MFQGHIAPAAPFEVRRQPLGVVCGTQRHVGAFIAAGDGAVVGFEDSPQRLYSLATATADVGPGHFKLRLEGVVEAAVGVFVAQQAVALFKRCVVANERVEITAVALCNNLVKETAPFRRFSAGQLNVGRRKQHCRKKADVIGQALIGLSAALEGFPAPGLYSRREFLFHSTPLILRRQGCELLPATHEHGVGNACKTLAQAKKVYRVEQITLTHAVVAQETVDFRRKLQRGLADILEIGKCKSA